MEKSLRVRPLFDRVLLKREEAQEKTPGGIFLPDSTKEKPKRGKVLAVGPGNRKSNGEYDPMSISVGQIVMFTPYAGNEIEIDGEQYMILSERDVLVVVD